MKLSKYTNPGDADDYYARWKHDHHDEYIKKSEVAMRGKTKFKVGDVVDYHSIIDGPVTSTGHKIRHIGKIPGCKDDVYWLTEKVGFVTGEALSFTGKGGSDESKLKKI